MWPYLDPERPVEPPEPAIVMECDNCGDEIREGDDFFDVPGAGRFCENCMAGWKLTAELPQKGDWL